MVWFYSGGEKHGRCNKRTDIHLWYGYCRNHRAGNEVWRLQVYYHGFRNRTSVLRVDGQRVRSQSSKPLDGVTVTPESGDTEAFTVKASVIQSGVTVTGNKVTGTLKYLDSTNAGPIVSKWGNGYFLFVGWSGVDSDSTSLLVGMTPSAGSGLVEAINDPDANGIFKVTDKNKQMLTFIQSDGAGKSTAQYYDLSGLTFAPQA